MPDQISTVTVTFIVENTYEDGVEVVTSQVDLTLPSPTDADMADDLAEWAEKHLYPYTGAGRARGNAFYDLDITAANDPRLQGRHFDWGY